MQHRPGMPEGGVAWSGTHHWRSSRSDLTHLPISIRPYFALKGCQQTVFFSSGMPIFSSGNVALSDGVDHISGLELWEPTSI